MMQVIPVIDLLNGEVVHAKKGLRQTYQPMQSPLCPSSDPLTVVSELLALHPFKQLYIADLNAIQKLLKSPKKITIISHRNPDGDAMGSSLALLHFLKQLHHEVTFISPNEFPDFLAWLPGTNEVVIFEREFEKASKILTTSDLIFTLDFNA